MIKQLSGGQNEKEQVNRRTDSENTERRRQWHQSG